MIDDGQLGTILEMRGRGKEDQRGGAEDLWVLGSHLLNLMQVFAGDPASCFARATSKGLPTTKNDDVEARPRPGYRQRRRRRRRPCTNLPAARPSLSALAAVRKVSRRGSPQIPRLEGNHRIPDRIRTGGPFSARPWLVARRKRRDMAEGHLGRHRQLAIRRRSTGIPAGNVAAIKDLLGAIEQNRQPLCSAYSGRTIVEMIMAVFESQRLGKPVSLPLSGKFGSICRASRRQHR